MGKFSVATNSIFSLSDTLAGNRSRSIVASDISRLKWVNWCFNKFSASERYGLVIDKCCLCHCAISSILSTSGKDHKPPQIPVGGLRHSRSLSWYWCNSISVCLFGLAFFGGGVTPPLGMGGIDGILITFLDGGRGLETASEGGGVGISAGTTFFFPTLPSIRL